MTLLFLLLDGCTTRGLSEHHVVDPIFTFAYISNGLKACSKGSKAVACDTHRGHGRGIAMFSVLCSEKDMVLYSTKFFLDNTITDILLFCFWR
jgi:hypothetical protein